jgi:hypothetical protein
MKKITQSLGLAAVLMFATSPAVANPNNGSLGSSITVSDQNSSGQTLAYDLLHPQNGPGGYGNHEDQETETNPNTYTNQVWDLEGMYLTGNKLSMVGGFNFQTGVKWGGYTYKGGDIFIDNTGNAKYGTTQVDHLDGPGGYGSTGTANTTNVDGWDYVIHFDANAANYTVYQIDALATVSRVLDVSSSNPWTYVSGGTQIGGSHAIDAFGSFTTNTLLTYGSTTPGLLGEAGNNTHYYLTVDIGFLPAGQNDTFHYTVACGNDDLIGKGSRVPDSASTALLLGSAAMVLVSLRRRLGA